MKKKYQIILQLLQIITITISVSGLVDAGDGILVEAPSKFAQLVPAKQVENQAKQEYLQLIMDAQSHRALAGPAHPLFKRIDLITKRLIPQTQRWNPRAKDWHWEVNVIGSNTINAFCMPGGKIAVYSGLLQQLHLSDGEIAMVIGHEMAHAVREHARAQMGKRVLTEGGTRVGGLVAAGILGVDPRITDMVAQSGARLLELSYSRQDETQADLVGMDMAARAGYDPRSALSLWRKMDQLNGHSPPQWLSTHPANASRIQTIEKNLPLVMPLYLHNNGSEHWHN